MDIKNKYSGEVITLRKGSYDAGSHFIEPLNAYDKTIWEEVNKEGEHKHGHII